MLTKGPDPKTLSDVPVQNSRPSLPRSAPPPGFRVRSVNRRTAALCRGARSEGSALRRGSTSVNGPHSPPWLRRGRGWLASKPGYETGPLPCPSRTCPRALKPSEASVIVSPPSRFAVLIQLANHKYSAIAGFKGEQENGATKNLQELHQR
jgi:hypothetical protein